ncbi:hypothetical protein E4T47_05004 [Aureobasidium subglaciale]|nr:hypothetical protein E4T47_05004 [Aureobasidium subglaciale]
MILFVYIINTPASSRVGCYTLLLDGNTDVKGTKRRQTKPVRQRTQASSRLRGIDITGNSNDERASRGGSGGYYV